MPGIKERQSGYSEGSINTKKFGIVVFGAALNLKTNTLIMGMTINKPDEQDYITCESCEKQCTDIENMKSDSGSNWFCPECWEELAPGMKRDYEELKRNGEIDSDG